VCEDEENGRSSLICLIFFKIRFFYFFVGFSVSVQQVVQKDDTRGTEDFRLSSLFWAHEKHSGEDGPKKRRRKKKGTWDQKTNRRKRL